MTDNLRALALAATEGPWTYDAEDNVLSSVSQPTSIIAIAYRSLHCSLEQRKANGAFGAAANPAAVLALLDENDRLKAEIADHERAYELLFKENAGLRKDAEWREIDTAPKDGTVILLGLPANDDEDRAAVSTPGRWFEGYEDSVDDMGHNSGFMDLDFQEFSCPRRFGAEKYRTEGNQPTHWKPLPAPPDSAAKGEEPECTCLTGQIGPHYCERHSP